jgi:hypothetical protein
MRTTYIQICRHTKTNGRLCQSPAVSSSAFCYYHQKVRRTHRRAPAIGPGFSQNVLHSLRNANSIQQALAMVVCGLANGQIHPNQATPMLSALRLAIKNTDTTQIE